MWRNVTLQYRFNLLFAAFLLAWLVMDVGRMLAEAGPRGRVDSENVMRLTGQFVAAALAHVQDSPQPGRDLVALARLHQLGPSAESIVLKSLGREVKGRHYRGGARFRRLWRRSRP